MNFIPVPKPVKKRRRKNEMSKAKVKQQVIDRDGDWCLLCGTTGILHLHRVRYPRYKYELSNCVRLCTTDHMLVHFNKKDWQPLLIDYLEDLKTLNKLHEYYKGGKEHDQDT